MLLQEYDRASFDRFAEVLKLKNRCNRPGGAKAGKQEQILAYLEVIHARVRKLSRKRKLVFIDGGAGDCSLSFFAYHFYSTVDPRPVEIHCVDRNPRLMEKGRRLAAELGFGGMYFHAFDLLDYRRDGPVDMVYALHACDTATDRALYLGVKNGARCICSVSCCQHTAGRDLRNPRYRGITRHEVFRDRITDMVADSLRALLLEREGYEVRLFEFVSSRYTGKNVMLRACRNGNAATAPWREEYERIKTEFRMTPALEKYLDGK